MHPYYTTNFADREMFAYNANYQKMQEEKKTAKQELDRILAQPETRIKYAFEFMNDFGFDDEDDCPCPLKDNEERFQIRFSGKD